MYYTFSDHAIILIIILLHYLMSAIGVFDLAMENWSVQTQFILLKANLWLKHLYNVQLRTGEENLQNSSNFKVHFMHILQSYSVNLVKCDLCLY